MGRLCWVIRRVVIRLIKIMFVYSAIKIIVNITLSIFGVEA